jgi:hypothetical protein
MANVTSNKHQIGAQAAYLYEHTYFAVKTVEITVDFSKNLLDFSPKTKNYEVIESTFQTPLILEIQ